MSIEREEKIKLLYDVIGEALLSEWEEGFVASIYKRTLNGTDATLLSVKQIYRLDSTYESHAKSIASIQADRGGSDNG